MGPQIFKIVALAVIILPTIFVAIYMLRKTTRIFKKTLSENLRNRGQEVTSQPARVISRRREVSNRRGYETIGAIYQITFETDTGERLTSLVSPEEFEQAAEGDRGTLTRQGSAYRAFVPDSVAVRT